MTYRMENGHTTLSLAEIYRQVPSIFSAEVKAEDNLEVRFPWQKLRDLIRLSGASVEGSSLVGAETPLAQKLRSRKSPPVAPEAASPQADPPKPEKASEPIIRGRPRIQQPIWQTKPAPRLEPSAQTMPEPFAGDKDQAAPPLNVSQSGNPAAAMMSVATRKDGQEPAIPAPAAEQDALTRALDMASLQLAREKGGYERQLAALNHERQALVEERNRAVFEVQQLRKQINSNAGEVQLSPVSSEQAQKADATPDRSKKEYQRQLDELNRRIVAFESSQKESAQELGRERENRIKIERNLSAAERTRAEASALVESMRAEGRREFEAALCKREAEFARAQAQLQDRLEAALVSQGKEREELMGRVAELHASLEPHRASMPEESAPRAQNVAAAKSVTGDPEWEARAVASFEADIQAYRDRIKVLLVERDASQQEKTRLLSSAGKGVEGANESAASAELVAGLEKERTQLTQQIQTLEERLAKAEQTRARSEETSTERNESARELTKLRAASAQAAADSQLQMAPLQKQQAAWLEEKAELQRLLAEKQSGRNFAETEEASALRTQITNLTTELESSRKNGDAGSDLRAKNDLLCNELEGARTSANASLTRLRADAQKLTFERDSAQREREKLLLESNELRAQSMKHQEEKREIGEQMTAEIAHLREEIEKVEGDRAQERANVESILSTSALELADARRVHEEAVQALAAEISDLCEAEEASARQFSDETQAGTAALEKLAAERDAASVEQVKARQIGEQAREGASAELAKMRDAHQAALAAVVSERDRLRSDSDALSTDLRTLREAGDNASASWLTEQAALLATARSLEEQLGAAGKNEHQFAARQAELERALDVSHLALHKSAEELAAMIRSHEDSVKATAQEHERALNLVNAEKDRSVAMAASEQVKALTPLTQERDEALRSLETERQRWEAIRRELETGHAIDAAKLALDRDNAKRESAAVAQKLTALGIDTDGRLAEAQKKIAALDTQNCNLAAEMGISREAHQAQSAEFAHEFKAVVKQRDEALAELEKERISYSRKTAELAQQQEALAKTEAELSARFERELARMRRERDVLLRQRDELRDRLQRMVEDQRELLDDLAHQTSRSIVNRSDVIPRTREPQEANVIDITSVSNLPSEPDGNIHLQRIRPVPILPPRVRIL